MWPFLSSKSNIARYGFMGHTWYPFWVMQDPKNLQLKSGETPNRTKLGTKWAKFGWFFNKWENLTHIKI